MLDNSDEDFPVVLPVVCLVVGKTRFYNNNTNNCNSSTNDSDSSTNDCDNISGSGTESN